jgi:hypothetical protein
MAKIEPERVTLEHPTAHYIVKVSPSRAVTLRERGYRVVVPAPVAEPPKAARAPQPTPLLALALTREPQAAAIIEAGPVLKRPALIARARELGLVSFGRSNVALVVAIAEAEAEQASAQ